MRLLFLCCLSYLFCVQVHASVDVVFFNPGKAEESFWGDVDKTMKEAADIFDIDLEVVHANRDRLLMIDQVNLLALSASLPKYVVLVNEENSAPKMLQSLYGLPIYVALMLNDISLEERARLKLDPHWKAYLLPAVVPDNIFIGQATAQALVEAIESKPTEIVGVSGDDDTPASVQRTLGASSYFQAQSQLTLHQVINAYWREDIAYRKTLTILKRYPNLAGIWTANDHIAIGVLKAVKELGLKPGEDVFISSINTSEEILRLRQQGKIAALGGGHFLAGAVVLNKICQHRKNGEYSHLSAFPLFSLLEPNTDFFRALMSRDWRKIIFQKFNLHSSSVNHCCDAEIDRERSPLSYQLN